MEIMGQNIAGSRWSRECALSCDRASIMLMQLSTEEYKILEEFYSRLTQNFHKKDRKGIIAFWKRLDDYRAEQQTSVSGSDISANWEGNQLVDNLR